MQREHKAGGGGNAATGGEVALIEAVYYRRLRVYAHEVKSLEAAIAYLNGGENAGSLSSVGVFVDGQPHLTDAYVKDDGGRPPTDEEAVTMREAYAEAVKA